VRIAWFTIYVDDAIGTIGNLADPNLMEFVKI